jgi:hypothetical protein
MVKIPEYAVCDQDCSQEGRKAGYLGSDLYELILLYTGGT